MSRGSAVVEFALVVPVVILVLFAVVEIVVVGRTQLELANSAREGARQAATVVDPAAAVAAARAALGPKGAEARVSVERPHVGGRQAKVAVRLRHRLAAPLFGGVPIDLRAHAVMRVER